MTTDELQRLTDKRREYREKFQDNLNLWDFNWTDWSNLFPQVRQAMIDADNIECVVQAALRENVAFQALCDVIEAAPTEDVAALIVAMGLYPTIDWNEV